MKKLLVVAAHPDDEVIGCGATSALLIRQGWTGRTMILGEGLAARRGGSRDHEQLREEGRNANRILGMEDLVWHQLPDNAFDSVPLLNIIQLVEEEVQRSSPDLILTHHGGDLNVDHRRTFQAVLTACRPQPGFHHPDLYSFYVPSSTEWGDGAILPPFIPDTYVDVEKTLDLKVKALSCYPSEVRDSPHPRSLEGIRITARYWGNRAGLQAAEPFSLVRRIWKIDHE
jgi:LmbE family N-acetylglucosaminyl deacetylase